MQQHLSQAGKIFISVNYNNNILILAYDNYGGDNKAKEIIEEGININEEVKVEYENPWFC